MGPFGWCPTNQLTLVPSPYGLNHHSFLQSPPSHLAKVNGPTPFPSKLEYVLKVMVRARLQHLFPWRSWDSISAANGLYLLTDHIHVNDRAAAILASLLMPWVESYVFTASGTTKTA